MPGEVIRALLQDSEPLLKVGKLRVYGFEGVV